MKVVDTIHQREQVGLKSKEMHAVMLLSELPDLLLVFLGPTSFFHASCPSLSQLRPGLWKGRV